MNNAGQDTDAATIEPILERLIAEHGIEAVTATLDDILPGQAWKDWQRVANLVANIAARRLRRKGKA